MFKSMFKKKEKGITVYSPCTGLFMNAEEIHDEVFSKGLMGPSFSIKPDSNIVYSPIEGEIGMVFPTLHALGIKGKDGIECIVHIGVDTVKLEGKGFEVMVNEGDKVLNGTPLVKVDFDYIRSNNYYDEVIIAFQNTTKFEFRVNEKEVNKDSVVAYCE